MIRKFQKSDIKEVMKIWLEGNVDAHSFVQEEYWKSNFQMVKEQLSQAEVYVYEDNGTLEGFIGLQKDYIAGIFVKKEYRSNGIGKELLDYAKAIHRELTLNVYKKNCRAFEFYKREGFLVVSEEIDQETGEADIAMRWLNRETEAEHIDNEWHDGKTLLY